MLSSGYTSQCRSTLWSDGTKFNAGGEDARNTLYALMAADSFLQTRQIAIIDSKGNLAD
ncbi:MAG: hypothetical protein ABJB16_06105 [Saprospiraceae bacterium]